MVGSICSYSVHSSLHLVCSVQAQGLTLGGKKGARLLTCIAGSEAVGGVIEECLRVEDIPGWQGWVLFTSHGVITHSLYAFTCYPYTPCFVQPSYFLRRHRLGGGVFMLFTCIAGWRMVRVGG